MILYYLSICLSIHLSISTGKPVTWCKGCRIRKLSVYHWPNEARQIFKNEDHISGKAGCKSMSTMNRPKGKSRFEESSFLLRNNKVILIIVIDSPLTCRIHIHIAGLSHKFHGRTRSQMKKKNKEEEAKLWYYQDTQFLGGLPQWNIFFFLSTVYVVVLLK